MADQKKKKRYEKKKKEEIFDLRFDLVPSPHEMNSKHSEADHLRVNLPNI